MKQEPEAIKSITNLTHTTIQNLKTELLQKFLKSQYKSLALMLSQCMKSFEILISQIINSFGSQYAVLAKKLTTIDSTLLTMKTQNNHLKSELDYAKNIILQKQLKIQTLERNNASLSENVLLLQTIVAIHNQSEQVQAQDSLQNIDLADLEEYFSNQSSRQSSIQQLCQMEDNA